MKNSAKFLIISLTAAVVACPVTPEGGEDSSAAREYKITYTVSGSDSVTVNGPAAAKAGDTVAFTLDGLEFDTRLISVEYYWIFDSACSYNEATGEYSFTMPEQNTPVTVTVKTLTDVDSDGCISWRAGSPSQIVPGEAVAELTFDVNAAWTTSCTVDLTSTDESIIPASALSYKELTEGNSNAITGVTITVDLTQVSPGQTYLIAYFKSGNSSSQKGEITKRIEVTNTLNETILNATLEVDMSAFNGDTSDKYIQFVDQNYQNGSKVEERRTIYFADQTGTEDVFTLDLQFVEGHAYKVSVGKVKSGDSYVIDDSVSGGGSTAGDDYNGIIDSILRIKTDGSTIEINVKNEVVPLG